MNLRLPTKPTLTALLISILLSASPVWAESAIKEIKDFEKCIHKAMKEEIKKKKPQVRKLHKQCEPELEALLIFAQQASAQGLVISDENKLSIGTPGRIDSVN